MNADQQAALLRRLDQKLTAAGLPTGLFAYDHNWSNTEYPLGVLAATEDIDRVRGAAFHCYRGQPEAQQRARDAGHRVFLTACSGVDGGDAVRTFAGTLKWQTEHLVIRGIRSGAETVVLWNLALNERGGPHFGQCGTQCNGVVEVADGRYAKGAEYYVLGHVSKFVNRGAHRIASTTGGPGRVQNVTFENPGGSRVSVVLNATDADARFSVTKSGRSLVYQLPAGAVATFRWPSAPS
ncbi:glycoside hydrolase family 30 beta sandwich domain-containing protein [Streptomyces zagrosensis]|uniref:O-glycosyl hydrolase n=1 Tax=Streptomyces zagrosensis TaxID=1042984 RepID=A0A7W9QBK9_9ACTN|nr:glycoside hydrolase family 30 beta sandwich domain-containing protein [Streptomyces zagrosensis]MBB5936222.1 O-glycosyl hydrolase [Streptomyces zagrosensis]